MINYGKKIESADIAEIFSVQERLLLNANTQLQEMTSRLESVELALAASHRERPAEKANHFSMFAEEGPGCERLGNAVVTARPSAKLAFLETNIIVGTKELLYPGNIWAVRSNQRVIDIDATINPAYLTQYNELLIPFISGDEQLYYFYHSQGHDVYPVTSTQISRFSKLKEWTGRIVVRSTSNYHDGYAYIHTGVAPTLYNSSWAATGTVIGNTTVPTGGVYRFDGVYAEPGHIILSAARFFIGGVEVSGVTEIEAGASLRVEAELPWNVSAPFVSVAYTKL